MVLFFTLGGFAQRKNLIDVQKTFILEIGSSPLRVRIEFWFW